jgi:hypothetical protein
VTATVAPVAPERLVEVPILTLVGGDGSSRRAVPLLALLGREAQIEAWHRRTEPGPPDAVVAASVAALNDVGREVAGLPIAVFVDNHPEVDRALALGATVVLSSQAELVGRGAVLVPSAGLEVDRWPPLAPLVRRRWRERYGLPARHVVRVRRIDEDADPTSLSTQLAVASAAVVGGPPTLLALALGTPVVTSADTARRLGLTAGREVEVATDRATARELADAIAADDGWAATLSRRGRRFAELHLDLGRPARLVAERLGLRVPERGPCAKVEARLAELATPEASPVRQRIDDALGALTSPA